MKKILTFIFIFSFAILLSQCAKVDQEMPLITIIGGSEIFVSLNDTIWSDPGFTALDNIDGDVSTAVVTSSDLNLDSAGVYTIYYIVFDQAGNMGESNRKVNVVNDAQYLSGFYNVKKTDNDNGGVDNYFDEIHPCDTVNNRVYVNTFSFTNGANVYFIIDSNLLEVPLQTIESGSPLFDRTFEGSGQINWIDSTITINYTHLEDGSTIPINCTEVYEKQ